MLGAKQQALMSRMLIYDNKAERNTDDDMV